MTTCHLPANTITHTLRALTELCKLASKYSILKSNIHINSYFALGVASTFEVVRPGSRSGLLWVCQEVGVVSFCCRLHVLFYF